MPIIHQNTAAHVPLPTPAWVTGHIQPSSKRDTTPRIMFSVHREKLCAQLGQDIAFLTGGVSSQWYDSDTDIKFRQESNFYYVTGCPEPDCCCMVDGSNGKFILFVPEITAEHELWMGKLMTPEQQKECYKADELVFTKDMLSYLEKYKDRRAHVILDIPQIPNTKLPMKELLNDLQPILAELRLYKDDIEIADLRESCAINAKAHNYTMAHIRVGMMEYQMEAMHTYVYLMHGSRCNSFCAITSCGSNSSILHFVNNTNQIQKNQTVLMDAGCEIRNACSDHTRTFPSGETFTKKQEDLYKIVLECNKMGIGMMKPGVKWEDVHFECLRCLLKGLRQVGIVRAEFDFEEQFALGIPSIFQPHGLGHMLGLNTHDVGGYNKEIRPCTDDRRIKYLRTRRTLAPGMVLTVEPGLYFIDGFLEEARNDPQKAKHIDFAVLEAYKAECGGYRIEDDVLVTADGHEVLPGPCKELDEIYALRRSAYAEH